MYILVDIMYIIVYIISMIVERFNYGILKKGGQMEKSKTHFRKVFKSDHLGSADLEDFIEEKKGLIYTIKEVKQEYNIKVAGKKGDFNIAYFKENIKPLVLNATNSKVVKSFCGGSPFIEDWKNVLIELYIDKNVRLGRDTVSGVRIRPKQPTIAKPSINPMSPNWNKVCARIKERNMSYNEVSEFYTISKKDYDLCLSM